MRYRNLHLLMAVLLASAMAVTAAALPPPSPTPTKDGAVALVSWIVGSAELRTHVESQPSAESDVDAESPSGTNDDDATWRHLELLDRLPNGSIIRTAAATEVQVVFLDGRRRVIEAGSLATISSDGIHLEAGSLRPLPDVPAVARLPPLAKPGKHPGADRIRHELAATASFEMSPRNSMLPPAAATLRFNRIDGIRTYRIEVIDAQGREVFATRTESPMVRIPEGRLEPSSVYFWRVTSDRDEVQGGAFFATPDLASSRARHELVEQVADEPDPGLVVLLAEVDHRLGWTQQACQRLAHLTADPLTQTFTNHRLARFGCNRSTQVATRGEPQ